MKNLLLVLFLFSCHFSCADKDPSSRFVLNTDRERQLYNNYYDLIDATRQMEGRNLFQLNNSFFNFMLTDMGAEAQLIINEIHHSFERLERYLAFFAEISGNSNGYTVALEIYTLIQHWRSGTLSSEEATLQLGEIVSRFHRAIVQVRRGHAHGQQRTTHPQ